MQQNKSLHIPYIPELNDIPSEESLPLLLDKGVRESIQSLNWAAEYPYHPLTVFTTAHSGTHLFIDFFVRCNYLLAVNYTDNSPVSDDSCVEFFVAPGCDNHYWNFEFNCIGAINASHRTERRNPTRLTHGQLAEIKRYASCGDKPFREVEGLFTWNLLVIIPLSAIGVHYEGAPIKMKGNFYKCAAGSSQPHYLSWNPIKTPTPDFHRPEFFGDLILD